MHVVFHQAIAVDQHLLLFGNEGGTLEVAAFVEAASEDPRPVHSARNDVVNHSFDHESSLPRHEFSVGKCKALIKTLVPSRQHSAHPRGLSPGFVIPERGQSLKSKGSKALATCSNLASLNGGPINCSPMGSSEGRK